MLVFVVDESFPIPIYNLLNGIKAAFIPEKKTAKINDMMMNVPISYQGLCGLFKLSG